MPYCSGVGGADERRGGRRREKGKMLNKERRKRSEMWETNVL